MPEDTSKQSPSYDIAKLWVSRHRGFTPEEMIQRLIMIMSEKQLAQIIGVTKSGSEDSELCEDTWRLDKSTIHGHGVFSKSDQPAGRRLFPVVDLSSVEKTIAMGHINHSDDPNIEVTVKGFVAFATAKRDIGEGEELTVSYPDLPWLMIFDRKRPEDRYTGELVPPVVPVTDAGDP